MAKNVTDNNVALLFTLLIMPPMPKDLGKVMFMSVINVFGKTSPLSVIPVQPSSRGYFLVELRLYQLLLDTEPITAP
jgi:hypothetical protein